KSSLCAAKAIKQATTMAARTRPPIARKGARRPAKRRAGKLAADRPLGARGDRLRKLTRHHRKRRDFNSRGAGLNETERRETAPCAMTLHRHQVLVGDTMRHV